MIDPVLGTRYSGDPESGVPRSSILDRDVDCKIPGKRLVCDAGGSAGSGLSCGPFSVQLT